MNEDIKVHVVEYGGRKNLMMRFVDPATNKQVARSTGTSKKREAERVAAKWEAELREGRYRKPAKTTWEEFCLAFEVDETANIQPRTVDAYCSTLSAFKKHCRPTTADDITTAKVTAFARELRKLYTVGEEKRTRSEASIARHLWHLKVICRQGHRQGFVREIPVFDMPKRASGAKRMKGRPITLEEFERILAVTPKVVGKQNADSWKLLLRGLWYSGLRLGEALALRWQ